MIWVELCLITIDMILVLVVVMAIILVAEAIMTMMIVMTCWFTIELMQAYEAKHASCGVMAYGGF